MSLDDIFETVSYSGIDRLAKDDQGLPMVDDDENAFESVKAASTPITLQDELLRRSSGLALQIGDRVDVECMGFHWGEGTITERSNTDFGGTKMYPVFHVESDDGQQIWMSAISLHKISN